MLSEASVRPTLPVVEMKRARQFYEGKLGLKVIKTDPSGALLQAGNSTSLYIYQRGQTKADHTVAAFTVKDVEAKVNELKAEGVKFEEYDMPAMGIKTVDGVATMGEYKAAWFKDTEGNIPGLSNM